MFKMECLGAYHVAYFALIYYCKFKMKIETAFYQNKKKAGRMKKTFAENNAAIKVYKRI